MSIKELFSGKERSGPLELKNKEISLATSKEFKSGESSALDATKKN